MSDTVARHANQLREDKGWSVARLAERCAAAGAPDLNANVLTNLLTRKRRRRDFTLEETDALARALDVPFYDLLPTGAGPSAEELAEMDASVRRIRPLLLELAGELEKMGDDDG